MKHMCWRFRGRLQNLAKAHPGAHWMSVADRRWQEVEAGDVIAYFFSRTRLRFFGEGMIQPLRLAASLKLGPGTP